MWLMRTATVTPGGIRKNKATNVAVLKTTAN